MDSLRDTADLIAKIHAGQVPDSELYSVIHSLGHGPITRAKPTVEAFLQHSDPQVRYIALNVLTIHWGCIEHRATCEYFAEHDADSDNRRMGIAGLGAILEKSRDSAALKFLLDFFRNDSEELHIRQAAYSAILDILGAPLTEQPPLARFMDFEKDVNWKRIEEAAIVSGAR